MKLFTAILLFLTGLALLTVAVGYVLVRNVAEMQRQSVEQALRLSDGAGGAQ